MTSEFADGTMRPSDVDAAFAAVPDLIRQNAADRPSQIAVLQEDAHGVRRLDYAAFDVLADRIAAALQRDGVQPRDAVSVCAATSIEYAAFFIGVLRAGACVAPLSPSVTPESLAQMRADSGARLHVTDRELNALESWIAAPGTRPRPVDIDPDWPFNIIYSSGTTGTPKGIVHPHRMRWVHVQRAARLGYGPDAVTLLSTPLYSNTTLVSFLPTLALGGTAILMSKFDARGYLALAQKYCVTHTMLVPVQYQRLMASADFDAYDLSSFRMKRCTSAPFSAALKAEVARRWPGRLIDSYGLTEGGGTCMLDVAAHPDKLHTVGVPAPGHDIRLIDDDGNELPQGATGEVVGHSAGIMTGYHNLPGKTREAEWYDSAGKRFIRTGDIGRFDEDGFLVLVDRKKDVIISGGFNVYPSDLEEVVRQHADVADVSVVGVPSKEWGETPVGFVVLRDGGNPQEVLEWANRRLGKTQRLSAIQAVDALPRSAIGKVLKRELRSRALADSMLSRREALAVLASTAALPLVSACAGERPSTPPPAPGEADALALLDAIAENLLGLLPESATSLGIDTGARASLRGQLLDRSAQGQQRIAGQLRADLERANAFNASGLSHATRTSLEVVRSAYATALEGFALPYGDVPVGGWRITPYVVIQNVGAYLDIPRFLDSDHRVENAADAEAYLARLQSCAKQLDGELGRMQAARGAGLLPPAFLIDKALTQMRLSAKNARQGGSVVESIERRAKNIPGNWAERARAIAVQEIAPALERQIVELQTQRAAATNDAGMWARPRGDEYYRWALKASTTTTMSPDEVHEMGRSELERLHAQMETILKGVGYSQGTVGERMKALAKDPKYQFPEGDAGRAEIMAFIQNRLDWVRAQMPRAFNKVVNPNMEVKRLPPEEEPGAPGAYGGAGSIDGKIPGRFWINLRTTSLHSKYSLADLTFHEAIPGHIWQGEYTHEMPLIRQLLAFNAYSEGWALYAEQLADELGAYEGDPVGRLGYLQSIAFRACRLVVDTGIHAKRWTREQGVQFFVDVNGSNPEEVASEVDRYCSWPGQACGYKVGHSEINRQRDKATAAMGQKFDVKAFNDTVVLGGNVPLDVLATNVEEMFRS